MSCIGFDWSKQLSTIADACVRYFYGQFKWYCLLPNWFSFLFLWSFFWVGYKWITYQTSVDHVESNRTFAAVTLTNCSMQYASFCFFMMQAFTANLMIFWAFVLCEHSTHAQPRNRIVGDALTASSLYITWHKIFVINKCFSWIAIFFS